MHLTNTLSKYGFISKLFHWLTALLLLIQIPLGFYLVIVRLLNNFLNPTPKIITSSFFGQKFIAKLNHVLLYLSVLTITISGILKKLFNGEKLNFFFKDIQIQDNFDLADQFYDIHILANYTLIGLISLHILAVIVHRYIFKENILKKIL